MNYFFGFNGRIGRLQWWLGQIAILIFLSVAIKILLIISISIHSIQKIDIIPFLLSNMISLFAIIAIGIWMNVALCAKRYHDRNKSGLWYFIVLVPIIGALWQFIELGFLNGDIGSNNYGSRSKKGLNFVTMEADITDEYQPSNTMQASIDAAVVTRNNPQAHAPQSQPKLGGQLSFGKRGI